MWSLCKETDKMMCHIALKLLYKYPAKLDAVVLCGAPHVLVVENKASSRIPTEGSIQCMKPHNHRQRSGWLTFTGHFAPYYM